MSEIRRLKGTLQHSETIETTVMVEPPPNTDAILGVMIASGLLWIAGVPCLSWTLFKAFFVHSKLFGVGLASLYLVGIGYFIALMTGRPGSKGSERPQGRLWAPFVRLARKPAPQEQRRYVEVTRQAPVELVLEPGVALRWEVARGESVEVRRQEVDRPRARRPEAVSRRGRLGLGPHGFTLDASRDPDFGHVHVTAKDTLGGGVLILELSADDFEFERARELPTARRDGVTLPPEPALELLGALVEEARAAGVEVPGALELGQGA